MDVELQCGTGPLLSEREWTLVTVAQSELYGTQRSLMHTVWMHALVLQLRHSLAAVGVGAGVGH
jgi:hypothetical protein